MQPRSTRLTLIQTEAVKPPILSLHTRIPTGTGGKEPCCIDAFESGGGHVIVLSTRSGIYKTLENIQNAIQHVIETLLDEGMRIFVEKAIFMDRACKDGKDQFSLISLIPDWDERGESWSIAGHRPISADMAMSLMVA